MFKTVALIRITATNPLLSILLNCSGIPGATETGKIIW